MAKGTVLTKSKDGEEGRFPEGHAATELFEYVNEIGGAKPRAMGFKMEDSNGGRLGFCVPKKESYVVYLTTIPHDSDVLKEFDLEVSKGSGGLATIKNLGAPKKTVNMLKKIYKAAEEAKPEKPKKEEKPKEKKTKEKKSSSNKKNKNEEPVTTTRKKRRKKKNSAKNSE